MQTSDARKREADEVERAAQARAVAENLVQTSIDAEMRLMDEFALGNPRPHPEPWDGPRIADAVSHPEHYRWLPGGIEAWDITGNFNFLVGSAIKYLIRHEHKGNAEQDIRKAIACLNQELRRREGADHA